MFKKGQSGNPGGRQPRKPVSDAILRALMEASEDGNGTKARQLADTLVKRAIEGDMRAADIVLERAEGKAEQVINVNRTIRELTDDELAAIIAAGSGARTAGETHSEDESSVVH